MPRCVLSDIAARAAKVSYRTSNGLPYVVADAGGALTAWFAAVDQAEPYQGRPRMTFEAGTLEMKAFTASVRS